MNFEQNMAHKPIAPLPPADITQPNLVVKPNKHARLSGDTSGS